MKTKLTALILLAAGILSSQERFDYKVREMGSQTLFARINAGGNYLIEVLPAVLGCLGEGYDALALNKPQFEVGRGLLGKGGVVREPRHRRAARKPRNVRTPDIESVSKRRRTVRPNRNSQSRKTRSAEKSSSRPIAGNATTTMY